MSDLLASGPHLCISCHIFLINPSTRIPTRGSRLKTQKKNECNTEAQPITTLEQGNPGTHAANDPDLRWPSKLYRSYP
jgi:hypothetical protein